VQAVLESGECVVATARRISVLDDIKARYSPTQLLIIQLDVAINEQIDSAFKAMIDHFGRVDVVVNNAGYVGLNIFAILFHVTQKEKKKIIGCIW
jgi:NADP-dependent 3-hydroxy acid dehydrogenase YdfG